ncbi:hypothetical protein D3C81_1805890 [compost metagenome]
MFAIDQDVGNARIVITHQCDAPLAFGLDQMTHALQHLVNVAHRQRRQLVGAEHAVDQVTQAVGFFDDDVGVILQAFFRQFTGQQLRCATNSAQWVLDFVSEAAHQHLAGFLFGELCFFLGDAQ